MRPAIVLLPALAAMASLLAGCGYTGDPKPPALRRPERVRDLAAEERGSKIDVTFILPQDTTEGLPIEQTPDIEMRIGVGPDPWDEAKWVTNSSRIPVPAWEPLSTPGAAARSIGKSIRARSNGATGASGGMTAAQRRRTARQTAEATATERREWYSRDIEIDAAPYVGKPTVIGVKVHGPKGRDDGWSFINLDVLPPLPIPQNVTPSDARNAVHLQWTAAAPQFLIFRKRPEDTDWTQIGETTKPEYDDATAGYGKPWEYSVQSVQKIGERSVESGQSPAVTFTPKDRFPPEQPMGLSAIAGASTIELSWNSVTDADLAGYRVYRGGVKIADGLQSPVYSDKDVTAGSRYVYQVSAVDQAGNESEKSEAAEVTMQ
ncbi:MAG TPA: hypothetical protein VHC90_08210 [Bryobacteraceae bacterium]|nr:hypothetical protein [Bryobacteraceae bacterium]